MRLTTAPLMLIAEARMAVQYLERAEGWAAGVDEEIMAEMQLVHQRLLEKIDSLGSRCAFPRQA